MTGQGEGGATGQLMAWKRPKRGKAHRGRAAGISVDYAACNGAVMRHSEYQQVPLSQVAPRDRCKFCWSST